MTTRVKWSVGALALWALGTLTVLAIMLGIAAVFGMIAWQNQDRWIFGMPCVFIGLLAVSRVPMMLGMLWEILCEVPGAVRERRWWGNP